jgi:hypothetical protein
MKRVLWVTVACLAAVSLAAFQFNKAAPGQHRTDAPAQHELGRVDIKTTPALERLMDPREAVPEPPLDPRIVNAIRMTDDTTANDFPDIASNPKNRAEVWCAWQSYGGRRDEIRIARVLPDQKMWGTWMSVPGVSSDVWRAKLAFDAQGRLWVVWSQNEGGNFDLYARAFDGDHWGRLDRITTAPQSDIEHRVAADAQGRIWVAWQGFRGGQSDIFLASYDGKAWSKEIKVSDSPRNDWAPAVAVDSKGTVYVAWDTYDKGNYDVRMRRYAGGKFGPVIEVAATMRFEAWPSLAVDKQDRLWISYDAGPVGWGKDQGRLFPVAQAPGSQLLDERAIEVVCYQGDVRQGMAPDVGAKLPRRNPKVYATAPEPIFMDGQLAADDRGRIHLLLRNQLGRAFATFWWEYVSTLTADGWTDPAPFPYAEGRASMRAAAAPAADGSLWIAWPRDNDPRFSIFVNRPEETFIENVYTARYVPDAAASAPKLEIREPRVKQKPVGHEAEDAQVRAIRQHRVTQNGKTLRIFRGDLHRHSEFSNDLRSVPDGSFLDFYRYMMDAAAMDFGILSDHQGGGDREYWWWLGEKAVDLFYSPPNYYALYGYERSASYPDGHRNIVYTKRGNRPVEFRLAPTALYQMHNGGGGLIADDTKMLFEEVRRTQGVSIPHTSATNMGTDWRDNDREVEPVVEIFQGDRYSYECAGCPLSDPASASNAPPANALEIVKADGFVDRAWAKGYRLGVIASSDHLSTHISYALVYAENGSREAIHNAIRQRHTYAATDNIILEYSMGEHFMGEEFTSPTVPPLHAKIIGTGPIEDVVVVRNNKVIYQTSPRSATAEITYEDRAPKKGLNFYYVRAVQKNRMAAWSSPIWVNVK